MGSLIFFKKNFYSGKKREILNFLKKKFKFTKKIKNFFKKKRGKKNGKF